MQQAACTTRMSNESQDSHRCSLHHLSNVLDGVSSCMQHGHVSTSPCTPKVSVSALTLKASFLYSARMALPERARGLATACRSTSSPWQPPTWAATPVKASTRCAAAAFTCPTTPAIATHRQAPDVLLQVPFVKWLGVTKFIAAALNHLSVPVTSFMFGISGQQLFMSEPEARAPGKGDRAGHEQQPPLLLRLAFDVPGEGRFFSALRLFRSRTCYGNADKDHLVGWANSTLRFTDELPVLDLRNRAGVPKARGVVLEDPPHSTATGRTTPAARRNSLAFACLGDELPTASGGDRSGGAASARVPVASTAGSGAAPAAPPAREQDSHVSQVRRCAGLDRMSSQCQNMLHCAVCKLEGWSQRGGSTGGYMGYQYGCSSMH